jgi:hypothetical protein
MNLEEANRVQPLFTEAIKGTLLEILGREEYFFEDARGLAEGNRVKVGEPEPLRGEPRLLKLLTQIERALPSGCQLFQPS